MVNLPEGFPVSALDPRILFPDQPLPDTVTMPIPKLPREEQQEQFLRDMEIDLYKYYPPDVDRDLTQKWPEEGISLDVKKMLKARGIEVDDEE
jgi:ribonuclease Z